MKHTCKAPDCTRQIPDSLLMCPRHWAQVPRNIQIRVTGAWRALGRGGTPEKHTAYLEARAAAIASLTKIPPEGRAPRVPLLQPSA
jgi:hypothetical protein